MLLQACKSVSVYGFGLDDEEGSNVQYHYFHLFSPAENMKKNSMNPTHSFDAERELLRALDEEGRIMYCGYRPSDPMHNSECGLKDAKPPRKRTDLDEFPELDIGKVSNTRWS